MTVEWGAFVVGFVVGVGAVAALAWLIMRAIGGDE